jgi:hypothetical protein
MVEEVEAVDVVVGTLVVIIVVDVDVLEISCVVLVVVGTLVVIIVVDVDVLEISCVVLVVVGIELLDTQMLFKHTAPH